MKEVLNKIARAFYNISSSKSDEVYVPNAFDFNRSQVPLIESILFSAIDEFRGLPFHSKRFVKPVIETYEQIYKSLTGKPYDWRTPEDNFTWQRLA